MIITPDYGIVHTKLPEKFEYNADLPFMSHYREKIDKDISFPSYQFTYQKNHQPVIVPLNYIENVAKAINFLEKHKYNRLVGFTTVMWEVIDMYYKTNIMERGVIKDNISSKRIHVGRVETDNFDHILSKEISTKFSKLAEISMNNESPDRQFVAHLTKRDLSKENIINSISSRIDYMNHYHSSHPNILMLPIHIYDICFGGKNSKIACITPTNDKIEDIEVWINPHSKDIILANNLYQDKIVDPSNLDDGIVFFSMMLFAKKSFEMTEYEFKGKPDLNPITNKYHFKYVLGETGRFILNHYSMIMTDK